MSSSSGRRSAGRQSQSNSTATSSASSPGHLPTTTASRARGNGNGGGARFEDFADSTVVTNADDTFGAAIKGKQRASAAQADEESIDEVAAAAATTAQPPASSSSTNTRRPRKTFNEVADDSGFVFTVESKRDAPSAAMGPPKIPASKSKANAPPPSTSRSKFISEPLPSDQVGETPINRRNRLFRGGGPNLPSTPASRRTMSGSSSSAARRSSLNFKTSRRSSSLRDGSIAYPHPSVPDKELYRHCADNMPPVARMKHLAGWTLERARAEVLEATPSASTSGKRPTAPKGKRAAAAAAGKGQGQGEEDSVWNAQEKKVLERCRPSLEKVMLDTLRDLSDQKINISWLAAAAAGKGAASSTPQPRPNPLNESNKALAEQLSSLVAALRSENARWEEERKEIEAFEEQTASMLGAGTAAAATAAGSSRDVTSSNDAAASSSSTSKLAELDWTADELDPAMSRMMQDARRALALEEKWLPASAGASNEAVTAATDTIASAVRAAAATKRKAYEEHLTLQRKGKRKSDMVPRPEGDDDETMIAGTDLDPRWRDVEYRADVLHSHTHIADRLSLLSSSYTSSISARAAQALRQLAFAPGDATEAAAAAAGSSTSAAEHQRGSGGGSESAESRKAGRERLEKILRGVRESIGPVRRQEIQDEDAEAKAMEEAAAAEAAAAEVGGGRGGRGAGADDSGVQLADQSAVDLFRAYASTKRSAPNAGGAPAAGGSKGRKSARSSRR